MNRALVISALAILAMLSSGCAVSTQGTAPLTHCEAETDCGALGADYSCDFALHVCGTRCQAETDCAPGDTCDRASNTCVPQ